MQSFKSVLNQLAQGVDFWSVFCLKEVHEEVGFRNGVQQPCSSSIDTGALITVIKDGALGYCSSQTLTTEGIKTAYIRALQWAIRFKEQNILSDHKVSFSDHVGNYQTQVKKPLAQIPLSEKLELLLKADKILRSHKSIVDTDASLWSIDSTTLYENSLGSKIEQELNRVIPSLVAVAHKDGVTQTRSLGGLRAFCEQGGWERIVKLNLEETAQNILKDAIDLVSAENCPNETMDAVIDPDQMMLQIHESIGHPIELDRILGDERNYAGTSFVTKEMFGTYQYGSKLLNVSFDPTIPNQFATYAYDDEGKKAQKEFVIKEGLLIKPLGGAVSEARANMSGVANSRSSSWNRPPIDRMANLNVEAGVCSFDEIISSVKNGVYVKSNASWSIDDSRNKFQFGCEWGRLIKNGKLDKVVRNPNYRGISANFWRSLKMVGNESTRLALGSPYCGKGEPNQCIRVGHASPVCLFENIDVFGGE